MNSESQKIASGKDGFLLQNLLQNIPDHIYFKDRESRFVLVNPAMARLIGMHTVEEAVGKTDLDIFTQELADAAIVNIGRADTQGGFFTRVLHLIEDPEGQRLAPCVNASIPAQPAK